MTLVARAEILMDADQAKAELQATGTAAKGAAQDIRGVGTQGATAARGVKQLETAARTSATGLTAASSAANVNTAATQKMASANRLAAGSMGNLVAQGNDVFVMLAAGQNPLTLAIQQGTQITQVIGPLGAAGAFRALGGAVLAMLSPINLITIGALAATATVVNWFMSSSEEAESFADSVESLETRIDSLKDQIAEASATRLELADRFGEGFVDRAQDILDRIVEAEKRVAQREAASNIGTFVGETGINPSRGVGFNRRAIEDEFDFGGIIRDRSVFDEQRRLAEAVAEDLIALQDAAGGTIEQQQAAIEALILSYTAAAEAVGTISEAEEARLLTLDQMRIRLAEVAELQSQDPEDNRQSEEMLTFLELVTKATGEQLTAEAAAQAMLLTMVEQNAVAEAIARTGADSAEVTRLRAQFALDAALAEADASDASEATKEEMRQAAQHAFEIATADMSGSIRAAADEAARLRAEVLGAVDAMFDLQSQGEVGLENARIRAEFRDDPIGRAGALAGARFDRETAVIRGEASGDTATVEDLNARRDAVVELARETSRLNELARPARSNSGSRGGSAKSIEKEREGIDRLIASKQREIEALRESDPVQREMIRLRERLTAATPKQRAEIEALVEAHENERVAMERKEEFSNAVDDVLLEAESVRDVWEGIGDMIIRAAKEALVLGTGPLSGLFGGSGGGGLLSGIFGGGGGGGGGGLGDLFDLFSGGPLLSFANGGLPGFASGGDPLVTRPGLLLGAGTGRGDRIRAMVSAGEFIMTAEATARNRAVLEAMNAGEIIPGFAGGGLPLPEQAAGATRAQSGSAGPRIEVVARVENGSIVQDVRRISGEVAVQVTRAGIEQFTRSGLPQAVDRINKDPRRRG